MARAAIRAFDPDVVLFHYSVFTYSFRGLPIYVPATARMLRRESRRLVTVLHEFAYPFGRRGLWGGLLAVSQRGVLVDVVRRSDALVATMPQRVSWLGSRAWLPQRPCSFTPVTAAVDLSLLPPDEPPRNGVIGVFGYGADPSMCEVIAKAAKDADMQLELVGAPGSSSDAGDRWQRAARRAGCKLSFTGLLDEADLLAALASAEVLVYPDPSGPSSRRTTLAICLAAGPTVAFHGWDTWDDLAAAGAVELIPPTARALSSALRELRADHDRRQRLMHRGRAFQAKRMSPDVVARVLLEAAGA
jgi:hypothetical protein